MAAALLATLTKRSGSQITERGLNEGHIKVILRVTKSFIIIIIIIRRRRRKC